MANVNLEFAGNMLRVLRLDDAGSLMQKDEFPMNINFSDEMVLKKNRDDLVTELSDVMRSSLNESTEGESVGILLDTSQTFLNVFPVDFDEDQRNINSHILWEFSNYFPETYKNFNIKYFRLNNKLTGSNIDDVLMIAIDKAKIGLIKELCAVCGMKIRNIEVDHFAVEKTLKVLHSDRLKNRCVLLIGSRNNRLDYSFIVNESLHHYDYDISDGISFKNLITSQLNFYNSEYDKAEEIFLYGISNVTSIGKFLSEQFPEVRTNILSMGKSKDLKYAPLFGLAWKNKSKVN